MQFFQPINEAFVKKCKLFQAVDLEFLKNIGVVILSDEMQKVWQHEELSTWWLVAHPYLDLYNEGIQTPYPPMALKFISNNRTGITEKPTANTYFDESYFERLTNVNNKTVLLRRFMEYPAMHPHVAGSTGICTGEGRGVYHLMHGNLKTNQEDLMMLILDLKRWASSIYIHGAYYEPGTYLVPELPKKITNKWPGTTEVKKMAFSRFLEREDACAIAGYLKVCKERSMREAVKNRLEQTMTWESDDSGSPIKIKNVRHGITADMIMALAFVEIVSPALSKNKSDNVINVKNASFSRNAIEILRSVMDDHHIADMYRSLLAQSKMVDEVGRRAMFEEEVTVEDISHGWVPYGKGIAYSIESEYNVAILRDVFDLSDAGFKPIINMMSTETILQSVSNHDIKKVLDVLVRIYARFKFVRERRLAVQYHQHERELNDFLRHLEANGGENPLLP